MANLAYGVGLFPTEPLARTLELAKLAEELGYEHVLIGDSHLIWREACVTMTAVALATSKVKVGAGVMNPLTRHPSVVASAHATLAEHAPGRVLLGMGLGDSSVRTMGLKPATLEKFEQAVLQVRELLAGRECEGLRMAWGSTPVPIYVAASGPKMLELAGRVADGVIAMVGVADSYIAYALERIGAGANAAGRRIEDIDIVLRVPCAVSDSAQAIQAVKSHVARAVAMPLPYVRDPAELRLLAAVKKTYDYEHHLDPHADHADLIPDAIVERFALAGTVAHCASEMARIAHAGIQHVSIVPYAVGDEGREGTLRGFARAAT